MSAEEFQPDSKPVTLSHFINPSRFWLFDLELRDLIHELRKKEAQDFAGYQNKRFWSGYTPKIGDFVAYKSDQSNKWIRCIVDGVRANKVLILWAVDYGRPLTTRHPEKLLKIDVTQHRLIIGAGLNVLPAKEFLNEKTKKTEMEVVETWTEEALNLFERLASTAKSIRFEKTDDIRDGEINFGELHVEMEDRRFNVGSELVRLKLAIHVSSDKFLRYFNSTASSLIKRWDENSMLGGVLNTPDLVEVGEIAGIDSHPFLYKDLHLKRQAEQNIIEAEMGIIQKMSISKVSHWLDQHAGIEMENMGINSVDIEKLLQNVSRPVSMISPTNRSRNTTEKLHSSQEPSQIGSVEAQTSSCQSDVPSPGGSFSFLRRKTLANSGGEKLSGLLGFMKKMRRPVLLPQAFNEEWMRLKEGSTYPVLVSSFESVNCFFVQVIDDRDGWNDLTKQLENFKCLEVLQDTEVGMLCLVEANEELHRAKIIRKSEFTTLCFCVDSGELIYFQNEMERIYQIPEDIVSHMPFQAICCRLAGIKAPSDYSWTNIIYQKVVKRICQQRIRVEKEIDPDSYHMAPPKVYRCYDVVLLDRDAKGNDINVNELLIQNQLAESIEEKEETNPFEKKLK